MDSKQKIVKMTRSQYDAHILAAKRELKRLKEEIKLLKVDIHKSVSDYKLAQGYESTLRSMFS